MVEPRKIESQLCFGIYNTSKKFSRYYQIVLSQFNLTYPQYITMLVLWEHAPMIVRELGSYLDLDSGTLTPLLKRLEKQGWVTRTRSHKDERVVIVDTTDYAKEQRDKVYEHVNQCFSVLDMSQEDIQKCLKMVNAVGDRLDNVSEQKLKDVE